MKKILIVLALILSVPFLGQTAEITDGLVLYMPLDEGTGKKVKDLSGTKAEGELKGGKWVDGKFGNMLAMASGGPIRGLEPMRSGGSERDSDSEGSECDSHNNKIPTSLPGRVNC